MRDAAGIYGKGSAGPLFPSSTPRPKPKSLLEAISDIEKLSAVERTGNPIPEHFLLLNEKIAYFDVGLKGGWADAMVTLFLVPLSMGVIDHIVPIFGSSDPSIMDQAFSMIIGVSYMLGYNILMAFNLGRCMFGPVCRNAIWQLYGGFVAGSILKVLLVFFLYHFMYVRFTPEFVSHLMTSAYPAARPFMSVEHWDKVFYWFIAMRDSLFKSGVFVVLSTLLCLGIPGISFMIGSLNANRESRLKREYDGY
jgi:hypothetical protein